MQSGADKIIYPSEIYDPKTGQWQKYNNPNAGKAISTTIKALNTGWKAYTWYPKVAEANKEEYDPNSWQGLLVNTLETGEVVYAFKLLSKGITAVAGESASNYMLALTTLAKLPWIDEQYKTAWTNAEKYGLRELTEDEMERNLILLDDHNPWGPGLGISSEHMEGYAAQLIIKPLGEGISKVMDAFGHFIIENNLTQYIVKYGHYALHEVSTLELEANQREAAKLEKPVIGNINAIDEIVATLKKTRPDNKGDLLTETLKAPPKAAPKDNKEPEYKFEEYESELDKISKKIDRKIPPPVDLLEKMKTPEQDVGPKAGIDIKYDQDEFKVILTLTAYTFKQSLALGFVGLLAGGMACAYIYKKELQKAEDAMEVAMSQCGFAHHEIKQVLLMQKHALQKIKLYIDETDDNKKAALYSSACKGIATSQAEAKKLFDKYSYIVNNEDAKLRVTTVDPHTAAAELLKKNGKTTYYGHPLLSKEQNAYLKEKLKLRNEKERNQKTKHIYYTETHKVSDKVKDYIAEQLPLLTALMKDNPELNSSIVDIFFANSVEQSKASCAAFNAKFEAHASGKLSDEDFSKAVDEYATNVKSVNLQANALLLLLPKGTQNYNYVAAIAGVSSNELESIDMMFTGSSSSDSGTELLEGLTKTFLSNIVAAKQQDAAPVQVAETELGNDLDPDKLVALADMSCEFGDYARASTVLAKALALKPGHAEALIKWVKVNILLNADTTEILAVMKQHQGLVTSTRELNLLSYYDGFLQKNTHLLGKSFDQFDTHPLMSEKLEFMDSCLAAIDELNAERNEIDIYLADRSVIERLETERHLGLIKSFCEALQALEKRLEASTDTNLKLLLITAQMELVIKRDKVIQRTKEKVFVETNCDRLRLLYNVNYAHLGADICLRLFAEPIKRLTGLRTDEFLSVGQIVNHSVGIVKDLIMPGAGNDVLINEIGQRLKDMPAEQLQELRACMQQSTPTGIAASFNEFISKYGSAALKLKLGVAIADLLLLRKYNNYVDACKRKPVTNPLNYHENDPLGFDKWLQNDMSLSNAQQNLNAVKFTLDAFTVTQVLSTLLTIPRSDTDLITKTRKVVNTILILPWLTSYLHRNANDVDSNRCFVFLSCLIENMKGNDIQQLLTIHDDTIFRGLIEFLQRNNAYQAASALKAATSYIQSTYFLLNSVRVIYKTITYSVDQRLRENRVNGLDQEIAKICAELRDVAPVSKPQAEAKAVELYRQIKHVAHDYGGRHPKRYHLYACAMFSQHQLAGENELVTYRGDGNGFFKAVSCYTEESPLELRHKAVAFINRYSDAFKDFLTVSVTTYLMELCREGTCADELVLRALCVVLNRPILIAFDGTSLDFCRQGVRDGGTLLAGEPIFVSYDAKNERYDGLRLRGEWYFEQQLKQKLASVKPLEMTELMPECAEDKSILSLETELATLTAGAGVESKDDDVSIETLESEFASLTGFRIC